MNSHRQFPVWKDQASLERTRFRVWKRGGGLSKLEIGSFPNCRNLQRPSPSSICAQRPSFFLQLIFQWIRKSKGVHVGVHVARGGAGDVDADAPAPPPPAEEEEDYTRVESVTGCEGYGFGVETRGQARVLRRCTCAKQVCRLAR